MERRRGTAPGGIPHRGLPARRNTSKSSWSWRRPRRPDVNTRGTAKSTSSDATHLDSADGGPITPSFRQGGLQSLERLSKDLVARQQADHQKPRGWKVEKISGLHEDVRFEQGEHPLLF